MHADHHAEAVELRFRQREHAFLFDRILSGKNPEWIFQLIRRFTDRDLPFLHGFEQGALRLLRSAVDFVRENQIRENRSLFCSEFSGLAVEYLRSENVGGKHVRRELNALELRVDGVRDGRHQQRFRQSRHAFQ